MKHYFEPAEAVLGANGTSRDGLVPAEAERRLAEHGINALADGGKKTLLAKFLGQMTDPMVIVLIAAAVISCISKEVADAVIILIVVVVNAILGLAQESKAENAIEALRKMSSPSARVRREGDVIRVKSEHIVPGDIVLLEAGDAIPADMRLIEAASLKIEEAALTGESVPAEKISVELKMPESSDIPLGDRVNMAYMGTNAVYGRGAGVVTATGMNTEMGRIAGILSETEEEKTPLQRKLLSLSKILSVSVLGICVFVFFFGVFRSGGFSGGNVLEMLLTSVSLAVAAIPEGLVVVVTVLLSIGVTKMSRRNAIIRKLTAVETLGCTQVICSDKTGTLTQNKMTVVDHTGMEEELLKAAALCGDVYVSAEGVISGEPTEAALLSFAMGLGASKPELEREFPRVGEAPFDSERKMMSTVHAVPNGVCRQYTKGAPDEVLKRCDKILTAEGVLPLSREAADAVLADNARMADSALRVLGAAFRDHEGMPANLSPKALEQGLTFIGLYGMIDPVRPEVTHAVALCEEAGIRPVMITGDHKDTAAAIARELGILNDPSEAITGAEMAAMSDAEFESSITRFSVYARVQPEHKVRIVNTWRRLGKITAMTGDGVNDAPALKSSDIGVGMGITGTDVTKNVADMVLADDNFATIVSAVEEGRRIYENIRKAVQFLLASNLSEVVAVFVATVANFRLFAPIHILWINLVTDTLPAIALGMEESEPDSMKKPPRNPKEGIFAGGLGLNIILQGVIIAVLTLVAYMIGESFSHAEGMTMAFLTLSLCEVFHSLNMRSRTKSIFKMESRNKTLFGAMLLSFVLTLAVIYIPGLNDAFRLTALEAKLFFAAAGLAFLIIPIVEIIKAVFRAVERRRR